MIEFFFTKKDLRCPTLRNNRSMKEKNRDSVRELFEIKQASKQMNQKDKRTSEQMNKWTNEQMNQMNK